MKIQIDPSGAGEAAARIAGRCWEVHTIGAGTAARAAHPDLALAEVFTLPLNTWVVQDELVQAGVLIELEVVQLGAAAAELTMATAAIVATQMGEALEAGFELLRDEVFSWGDKIFGATPPIVNVIMKSGYVVDQTDYEIKVKVQPGLFGGQGAIKVTKQKVVLEDGTVVWRVTARGQAGALAGAGWKNKSVGPVSATGEVQASIEGYVEVTWETTTEEGADQLIARLALNAGAVAVPGVAAVDAGLTALGRDYTELPEPAKVSMGGEITGEGAVGATYADKVGDAGVGGGAKVVGKVSVAYNDYAEPEKDSMTYKASLELEASGKLDLSGSTAGNGPSASVIGGSSLTTVELEDPSAAGEPSSLTVTQETKVGDTKTVTTGTVDLSKVPADSPGVLMVETGMVTGNPALVAAGLNELAKEPGVITWDQPVEYQHDKVVLGSGGIDAGMGEASGEATVERTTRTTPVPPPTTSPATAPVPAPPGP